MSADLSPLATAVQEIEAHAAAAGWDQPAQVFALVDTAELLSHEPQLAAVLGIEQAAEGELTPVEQETTAESLEELLPSIAWPDDVLGCAVVLEASTVPPGEADGEEPVPSDPEAAAAYVAEHPERQDARIVAGVMRTGEAWCAIRQRAHDDDTMVLSGEDLVPALVELLHATFVPDPETAPHE